MISTYLPPDIESSLLLNPLENLNFIGFFKKHKPINVLRINQSYMACGLSDEHWWYISCKNRKDFTDFMQNIKNENNCFAVINDWMLEELKLHFNISQVLSCLRHYLPKHIELPKVDFTIDTLDPEDANEIFWHSNYKAYTSVDYIKEQITLRSGVCFRDKGKLVGWVLFHDDAAIGMLHVLENYRRKGMAKALVVNQCKGLRKKDETPFTSVEPSNHASLTLVKSIGFECIDTIHWVKVVSRNRT